ncbi:hypothetical protein Clacol_008100 [Clathrus columnatus]|uniref:Uncharacterized protein n=1 Tax=Clathrus columnatus TaxID=1419009 RepID=A0AAV5AMB7_9AGAM|nr:hypothetical protein Clacol_008100 [Clathrus columnatus]
MSDLHLSRFLNTNRPPLAHKSVVEIPTDILGQELSASILASLKVDSNDAYACSVSARLWEETLENYPCLPYLLLRVADMRFTLQSPGQQWQSITKHAAKLLATPPPSGDFARFLCRWTSLTSQVEYRDRYMNIARQELVYRGFYDTSFPLLDEYLIGGAVTCGEDALSILRDTYEVSLYH